MRLWLAFRVFFLVLFNREFAARVAEWTATVPTASIEESSPPREDRAPSGKPSRPATPPPARDHAITLLATLQREARFVDIVMEPLDGYTDAQIGAAARDVLRDCGKVLRRLFDIQPITPAEDGAEFETPPELDSSRYHVTGHVTGSPPFKGRLVHHGWEAHRCELPNWSGDKRSARVVAPVELEV